MANILKTSNYKTGLFTSPHLVKVNERIRINGNTISDEDIDIFIKTFKKQIEKSEATFFETITAMAFWYFKKENVDIAILETGLGGRVMPAVGEPLARLVFRVLWLEGGQSRAARRTTSGPHGGGPGLARGGGLVRHGGPTCCETRPAAAGRRTVAVPYPLRCSAGCVSVAVYCDG